jgi:hypothetical protein
MNTNQKTQCDSCAFKRTEDQTTLDAERRIEEKYKVLRNLNDAPKKPRIISVGGDDDKTETCFINSPLWPTKAKEIYCPDRIDDCLSLETALNIRVASMGVDMAREANRIADEQLTSARESASSARSSSASASKQALWARWAAIIATIAAIIATKDNIIWLISWLIKKFTP